MFITLQDYAILKDVYEHASQEIKNKLIELTIWQGFDLANSELLLGNLAINNGIVAFINDNQLYTGTLSRKVARKNDIIYIVSGGCVLGKEYIGRCFRIFDRFDMGGIERSVIKSNDTYGGYGTQLVPVDDDQYLILGDIIGEAC